MKAYLDYAFLAEQETLRIEKKLIAAKKPPLNLTGLPPQVRRRQLDSAFSSTQP